ncbi:MAG TPA: hypothetical protein VFF40_00815, partial [Acidimicrobiia bacterium]|nr:hypothetical protein [Acidimicrobiia bacterium]
MRWKVTAGLASLVLFAAACATGNGEGLSIRSFDVPASADCSDGEDGMVDVSWDTDEATEAAISVDGAEVMSGFDPIGDYTVDVICDGEDHDIELTASNEDRDSVSETETVSTDADGGDTGGGNGGGSSSTTTTRGGGTTSTTTTSTTTTTTPPTPPTPC